MTAPTSTHDDLREQALAALSDAPDEGAIEAWRAEWLGRQGGRVTSLLRSIKDQPPEARGAFGQATNHLKVALEAALEARRDALRRAAIEALSTTAAIDVTLPGRPQPVGRLHPVTQTMRDCVKAFVGSPGTELEFAL